MIGLFIPNWYLVSRNGTRFRFGNAPEQVYAESVDVDIVSSTSLGVLDWVTDGS